MMNEYQLAQALIKKYATESVETAKTIYRYEQAQLALLNIPNKVSLGELIRLQEAINTTQEAQDLAVDEMHFWANYRNTCPMPYDYEEHGYSGVDANGYPTGDSVKPMDIVF